MSRVKHNSSEPLLRLAKRDGISRTKAYTIRLIAVLLSLIVSGIFIFGVTKLNPIAVYEAIFDGAFGTPRRSWVTIRDTMMLLCIAIGLAPAFKMKFWNIGAEGQVLVGACVQGDARASDGQGGCRAQRERGENRAGAVVHQGDGCFRGGKLGKLTFEYPEDIV